MRTLYVALVIFALVVVATAAFPSQKLSAFKNNMAKRSGAFGNFGRPGHLGQLRLADRGLDYGNNVEYIYEY